MKRYDVMKQWSEGFVAALRPEFIDESKGEHWMAGYTAGYKLRGAKSQMLDEYLVRTGREPQAKIRLASATEQFNSEAARFSE